MTTRFDGRNLGSCHFVWEEYSDPTSTFTWYSVFLPTKRKTQPADAIRSLWLEDQKMPWDFTPWYISPVLWYTPIVSKIDGKYVAPGTVATADGWVDYYDLRCGPLTYVWEMREDGVYQDENVVQDWSYTVKSTSVDGKHQSIEFRVPTKIWPYRLFMFVHDTCNNAAAVSLFLRLCFYMDCSHFFPLVHVSSSSSSSSIRPTFHSSS